MPKNKRRKESQSRQFWHSFWRTPDPLLVSLAGENERLVARVRLFVVGLLLITPTYKLFAYPDSPVFVWGFGVTLAAFLYAAGVLWLLRRIGYQRWIGFATSLIDASLVSSALILFVIIASPLVALNSRVTFEIYFLIIASTALRFDPAISLLAGLWILLNHLGLWAVTAALWNLDAPELRVEGVGDFQYHDQITRAILLLAATLVSLYAVQRLKHLVFRSIRDGLTGVYSRGYFNGHVQYEFDRASRSGKPLAVAMIDADHFKAINDEYGHAAGDAVLKELAQRISRHARKTDMLARYGGEEFIIIFPETELADIEKRLDRLRAAIAANAFKLDGALRRNISISIGLAGFPADGNTAAQVIRKADERLLRAKQQGRNRVIAGG